MAEDWGVCRCCRERFQFRYLIDDGGFWVCKSWEGCFRRMRKKRIYTHEVRGEELV